MRVKGIYCLIVLLTLGLTDFQSARSQTSSSNQGPPAVTQWIHPENLPKPAHIPLVIKESLNLKPVSPPLPPGEIPPIPGLGAGRICLIVHSSIYSAISSALGRYQQDLQNLGYSVIVYQYSSGSPETLRSDLAGLYAEPRSLVGAVLIGNIPYIIYEVMQNWGWGWEYEDFPCDIFYMDLNGTWSDTLKNQQVRPGNGKYDTRSGNLALEIWVSRMKTDNLTALGSEVEILNSYFDKNHRYRLGTLAPTKRGLAYVDNDWVSIGEADRANLELIYGTSRVIAVTDPELTTALDYKDNRMTDVFEMVTTRSHGYPGGHGYYQSGKSVFNYLYGSDYSSLDPDALFYSLFVCSGCDYSADNYLGGMISFNPQDSGLVAWGSTKTGGMWQDNLFYQILAAEGSIGDAFLAWFNHVQSDSYYSQFAYSWWYGMVLIGDGTLQTKISVSCSDPQKIGSDVRITNAASNGAYPSPAWTGSEFGVSREDLRDGNWELYFARIGCACAPNCSGKICGDDGCGGSCGTCALPDTCNASDQCVCALNCSGKSCGDDGCGGFCGSCGSNQGCFNGTCACVPDCAGKECGDDSCGGSCRICSSGETCSSGQCLVSGGGGGVRGDGGGGGGSGSCAIAPTDLTSPAGAFNGLVYLIPLLSLLALRSRRPRGKSL